MKDVCFIFEFHQPYRLNRGFHSLLMRKEFDYDSIFDIYFDRELNEEIFRRIANNCYFPVNKIVEEEILKFIDEEEKFKIGYSLSGTFLEQCEMWKPELLGAFKSLSKTGCVEFLGQTYYHSLASLYGAGKSEFKEQVEMHRSLIKNLFNHNPVVFENTECIYNNSTAKAVSELGYSGIVTEGADRILAWRSPNHVYRAEGCNLKVLLRNHNLSDDIGFRFSSRLWEEWPLTVDKYVRKIESTPGEVIVIFIDVETMGEHHKVESGILNFMRYLPRGIAESRSLRWRTPNELIKTHEARNVFDVNDFATVSWADLDRDHTAWLGNEMQMIVYDTIKNLGAMVRALNIDEFTRIWRYLQTSDHFYYMSTKGGGPGEVHGYFNPYGSPYEAFASYVKVLSDYEIRLRMKMEETGKTEMRLLLPVPPGKAFTFYYEFARSTNCTAKSLPELLDALKSIDLTSITFHNRRGDFSRWVRHVIGDEKLADELKKISRSGLNGDSLRRKLILAIETRIGEIGGIKR